MKLQMIARLLLAFGILLLTSGCWDTKDINKRDLPVVIGVTEGEKSKYRVVLQVPSIKGTTDIFEKEADTISKAVDLIRTDAEKSIDLVHLRLFLISKELAKKGINEIIDYAIGANDISIKGMVAIVAEDFIKTMHHRTRPSPEVSSYDYFSEESGWTPNVSIVRVWEAYRSMHSYSQEMAIPLLTAGKNTLFTFEGSAVMRGNQMVGVLTPGETLLYNIFKGKYTGGTIEITQDISVVIKKAVIRHKTKWTSTGPGLLSNIYLDTVVVENSRGKPDDKIEQTIGETLNERAVALVDKLQLLNADVLGAGLIFRPKISDEDNKKWKEAWFAKLKHEIKVHVNVQSDLYFKEKSD